MLYKEITVFTTRLKREIFRCKFSSTLRFKVIESVKSSTEQNLLI
jgi:hypothetical protein